MVASTLYLQFLLSINENKFKILFSKYLGNENSI